MNELSGNPSAPTSEPIELLAPSPVVTMVFDQILAAVHRGDLQPGERISDAAIALDYGVSRTPVREALQRLREIGVIEASASRFTRVAAVTPQQTAQSYVVWLALYSAVVDEVIPTASPDLVAGLTEDAALFRERIGDWNPNTLATANYQFFTRLHNESRNPALLRAISSVIHVIRLGSQHLPDYIDLDTLAKAHTVTIEAVRTRDRALAYEAIGMLQHIEIPQD